ncbi:MAG: FYDLN acid domain-containing protein [Hyphomicrobium sp.]|jgi:uncharacterized protein (TIGR02300 family)|nr:FYDLN acid domain-containing protein [Hyphomicrobium sp.]
MISTAVAAKRGTKRLCQSEPCGLPFYDLNRDPIACPNCGEGYVPAPIVAMKTSYSKRPQYKLFKPVDPVEEPEEKLDAAGDDALDVVADDSDDSNDIEKVDTLLEIDEDDDGSDAIGTGVKKGEIE